MAQPVAISYAGIGSASPDYCVIDNGPATPFAGLVGGYGYDNAFGALSQGVNLAGKNGSLPDFVNNQTKKINSPSLAPGTQILFKNPS